LELRIAIDGNWELPDDWVIAQLGILEIQVAELVTVAASTGALRKGGKRNWLSRVRALDSTFGNL
jgi:hypothetical protein